MIIALEGPDGVGKSTLSRRLSDILTTRGALVTLLKCPGNTAPGDRVRLGEGTVEDAILDHDATYRTINHALARGHMIILDRSWLSMLAYQPEARPLSHFLRARFPVDLFVRVVTPPAECHRRLLERGESSTLARCHELSDIYDRLPWSPLAVFSHSPRVAIASIFNALHSEGVRV